MTDDLLQGGNAGKWSYRYGDHRDRFALTSGLRGPYVDMRDPWWFPQADRCWISPEINQRARLNWTKVGLKASPPANSPST